MCLCVSEGSLGSSWTRARLRTPQLWISGAHNMGGCQNYGPLLGPLNTKLLGAPL